MDITNKPPLPGTVGTTPLPPTLQTQESQHIKKKNSSKFKTHSQEPSPSHTPTSSQAFCVTALNSYLFEDSSQQERRKKQIQHGEDLLNQLDQLHQALLIGKISPQDLAILAHTLKSKPEKLEDPRLCDIIREIEIRVAVELAKLSAYV